MSHTVTTKISWTSRLGSSLKGVIAGIVLFLAGIILLFWNEGNYVKVKKTLEKGQEICVSLPSNEDIDSAYNNKLVHMSGKAVTEDELTDDVFHFTKKGIKLHRTVEYYQWVEESHTTTEKDSLGGGETQKTTYTYKKQWCKDKKESSTFNQKAGHENTTHFEADSVNFYAKNVSFGAFRLSDTQIKKIGGETPIKAAELTIPEELKGRAVAKGNYIYIGAPTAYGPQFPVAQPQTNNQAQAVTPQQQPLVTTQQAQDITNTTHAAVPSLQAAPFTVIALEGTYFIKTPDGNLTRICTRENGTYYISYNAAEHAVGLCPNQQGTTVQPGTVQQLTVQPQTTSAYVTVDPGNPQIGDVRIKWTLIAPEQTISIVAQQSNDTFAPYYDKDNDRTINLLEMGEQPADLMFANALDANSMITWFLRFGGWFAMYIGISMILKPLSVLADVVAIIGNIIEFGTKIIAFVVATVVSLTTIAIAWLFYRPLISIPLIVVAIALIYWCKTRKKKQDATKPTETTTA